MKRIIIALLFTAFATCANAATCFWVGGTGSWSTGNGVNWSNASGGSASTCAATGGVPKNAGDVATIDGVAGGLNGGTITVDSTMNGASIGSIGADGMVGTLDFSVNNPSITLTAINSFTSSGSGVRTINLGSGTFTLSVANGTAWNFTTSTNLTFNAGTSTIAFTGNPVFSGSTRNIIFSGSGARSYNNITMTGGTGGGNTSIQGSGAITIANLTLNPPFSTNLSFSGGMTITNAFTWTGTAFNNAISILQSSGVTSTVTAASGSTCTWCVLQGVTFAGTAVNATNSFDLKGNNMNGGSITGPSGGAATGHIIGG